MGTGTVNALPKLTCIMTTQGTSQNTVDTAKVRIPTGKMKNTLPAKSTDPMKTMHHTYITKVTTVMDQVVIMPQTTIMKTTTRLTVIMRSLVKFTVSRGHPMVPAAPAAATETVSEGGRLALTRARQDTAMDISTL